MTIARKFALMGTDHAPGQEVRQRPSAAPGPVLPGTPVDFSHGDVDAHPPPPDALADFTAGVARGGAQAYTEYRGEAALRELLAPRLAAFTGAPVDAAEGLIVTPGSQGALFLAVAATVTRGDRIAIVQPDYFANRKLAAFLEAEIRPVRLHDPGPDGGAGLDLDQLEEAFRDGARCLLMSNPNNPTGAVCSADEIARIVALAERYGATVIVDQLYARLRYPGTAFTHLRAAGIDPDRVVTIMGPSKTESLSGYRLGVAFGAPAIIQRMEQLQAIVSLRAAGYAQAVLRGWFAEPAGWLEARIQAHRAIRDDLLAVFRGIEGCRVRTPQAGSYLYPRLPPLTLSQPGFVRALREQAGVTVTPGTEFDPRGDDSLRLNFSQDHAAAVAAAQRLAAMVAHHRAG